MLTENSRYHMNQGLKGHSTTTLTRQNISMHHAGSYTTPLAETIPCTSDIKTAAKLRTT